MPSLQWWSSALNRRSESHVHVIHSWPPYFPRLNDKSHEIICLIICQLPLFSQNSYTLIVYAELTPEVYIGNAAIINLDFISVVTIKLKATKITQKIFCLFGGILESQGAVEFKFCSVHCHSGGQTSLMLVAWLWILWKTVSVCSLAVAFRLSLFWKAHICSDLYISETGKELVSRGRRKGSIYGREEQDLYLSKRGKGLLSMGGRKETCIYGSK